tara:strand:+ start:825 stop:1025 length:201 start_codon:yes stop_codon:yes gene_type:complete
MSYQFSFDKNKKEPQKVEADIPAVTPEPKAGELEDVVKPYPAPTPDPVPAPAQEKPKGKDKSNNVI